MKPQQTIRRPGRYALLSDYQGVMELKFIAAIHKISAEIIFSV